MTSLHHMNASTFWRYRPKSKLTGMVDTEIAAQTRAFARERRVPLSLVMSEALRTYVVAHRDDPPEALVLPPRAARGYHTKIQRALSAEELRQIRARGGRPLRETGGADQTRRERS
ncbi:MAG: hypothetical protein KGK34_02215 [Chloroflexota bacterium]|nr:hypothetical protein [Chloroflexota bacterium]